MASRVIAIHSFNTTPHSIETTRHYFQGLRQEMERNNVNMIIDGTGTLWHINDLLTYLQQEHEAISGGI